MTEESKGQEEMETTGDTPDEGQKGQLDDFFEDFQGAISSAGSGEKEEKSPEKEEEKVAPITDEKEEEAAEEEEKEGETDDTSEEGETEEEESEDSEEEEESSEEEEATEDDRIEMIAMRAEMAEQRALIEQLTSHGITKEKEPKVPKIEIDPDTLVTEDEARELLTNPHETLKKILARTYTKGREDTLKDIPALVESAAGRQQALTQAREKFFSENDDLVEAAKKTPAVGRLIRLTADKVQATNPDWTVEKIFDETAVQVRGALKLTKKAQKIEKKVTTGKKKASQISKPRSRRKAPPGGKTDKRSGLDKELDEMMESLNV